MLFLDEQWKDKQRADLRRALERRKKGTQWGMYIDPARCTGCRACQVACKAENNTPPGVSYIVVLEESQGTAPYTRRRYIPKPCMHCATPSCVIVCPVSATYETHDGIVVMDYMKCIGCRYCMTACPYSSRYFDVGDEYGKGCDGEAAYDHRPSNEYSRVWPREHDISPIGNPRKCHYCQHRLSRGLLPACIEACPTDALVFGDLNDARSLVTMLISENATYRMKEELGNEPKTYYKTS
jgi:molybdopterin-containing oxidoreductase family iron-sulfur binding subunit